jgi:hypothetical protein
MAFKGSAAPVKAGMKDLTNSNIARDGAAKKPQTKFATKDGMRSRIGEVSGVGGNGPDAASDASSPNVLDPSKRGKTFSPAPAKWGMKDANGQSVNHELGKQILNEGALTGR